MEELTLAIERLQAENKALLKLASHDMRSPLNKIFALVNLLRMSDDSLSEEQLGYLQNMELVLSDGLQNMRNLVDLRSLENDKSPLNLEVLDIAGLVKKLVQQYLPVAGRKNIKIILESEEVSTISDKLILSRILDQLIINAIKFSPANSLISLHLKGNKDSLTITITDGGPGINPAEQNDLFQKFKPLSSLTTGGESKTGIGLFIAQRNAAKLGGKIAYDNDKGSSFILELPFTSLA